MSDKLQRRLRRQNRLAELAARYGLLPERELPEPDVDPSWGPVGSLLKRLDPQAYEEVWQRHLAELEGERSRLRTEAPAEAEKPPAPPQPVKEVPAPRPRVRPAQGPPGARPPGASDW